MQTQWEVIKETENLPTLNNPIFIEGLPGIGNVGKIAIDFMIEELKAKKLYSFFSYKFPPSVFINEKNLIEVPKIEIYYKKFLVGNKKRDLLLLQGDIQPIDEMSCYTFCEEVLKIVKHYKCSEIITTVGIGLASIPENPKVYCTGNDEKLLKNYVKKELNTEKDIYGVVGPIMGVSGILLGLGKKRNIKGVALLAETFGHPMYLGVKGAKEIIKILEKKFSYGININKMSKEIIEVERELMKKTKEIATEMKDVQAGAKSRKKETGYIG